MPDVVIYLTLSPDAAAKRGQYGEERYETLDMQRRTKEQFALVAEEMRQRHEDKWVEIDADGSVEEVELRIWDAIPDGTGAVGQLWIS